MVDQQKTWVARVEKLINYMNYDWESDPKWKEYMMKKFKPKIMPIQADADKENKKELELMKRAYYGEIYDKNFESTFDFANEEERVRYFNYCSYYGNLGSIGPDNKKHVKYPRVRQLRNCLYFLFLLALPLKIPYTPLIYFLAVLCSVLEGSRSISRFFTDEEPMNLGLLLVLFFCGPFIKTLIYAALTMWAVLVWFDWVAEILKERPNAVGLALLKPLIEAGNAYKVEILQIKNHIEVAIGIASVCLVFVGKIAPIFPIFYWQYIRIKYVINFFTRNSFIQMDRQFFQRVVPGFLYTLIVQRIKDKLYYFVNYNQEESAKAFDKKEDKLKKKNE